MTSKQVAEAILAANPSVKELNEMQRRTLDAAARRVVVLLAPTGSGKTLAFTAVLLANLRAPKSGLQALVVAPSRELVLQIASVIRSTAKGYKTSAFYGGHSMREETSSLAVMPDIIVATPGRLIDHIVRNKLDLRSVTTLVIDEYDKQLELGFEDEMKRIVKHLGPLKSLTLTSATRLDEMPTWLPVKGEPEVIDFSSPSDSEPALKPEIVEVVSESPDKLAVLTDLLRSLPNGRYIIFANHRQSVERIYDHLRKEKLPAGIYHGGLEQQQREDAVVKLDNGSTPILVSTDLGSRGLDFDNVDGVVHYHLPPMPQAWTHRNGRTGRRGVAGTVYVIKSENDDTPEYLSFDRTLRPSGRNNANPIRSKTATLYFNLGKKEKVSRGDILGYLTGPGGLDGKEVGKIVIRDHSSLAAVPRDRVSRLLSTLSQARLKGQRVRVSEL